MKGDELILETQEVIVDPVGRFTTRQENHDPLNVPLFLVLVIGCAVLGYISAATKSKKITAAQSTAKTKESEDQSKTQAKEE